MYDALHKLKHDFLILGFTGPLRSGCTSCANFFCEANGSGLDKHIEQLINSYATIQKEIETLHKDLYYLRGSKDKLTVLNKQKELRNLLKKREVIIVLKNYPHNKFIYISMTDMLLKKTLEMFSKDRVSKCLESTTKRDSIIDIATELVKDYRDLDLDFIKKIWNKIENRDFHKIDKNQFTIMDEYLGRLPKSRKKVLKIVGNEDNVGELLQDFGDNLRRAGDPFSYERQNRPNFESVFALAKESNDLIKLYRSRKRQKDLDKEREKQFVIEAFRNPYEVEFFRNRYYEFYLVSLFSDFEIRSNRERFSEKRDRRDQGEDPASTDYWVQNVSECVRLSDIAINNEGLKEELYHKLLAYYALIKQPGCYSPEWEETAMHMAYSMSVRSSCISRQVGAVIEGSSGYIIGAGWNDVGAGQIGCGYRHYEDFTNLDDEILVSNPSSDCQFRRLLKIKGSGGEKECSFCFKDEYSEYEVRKKFDEFKQEEEEILRKLTPEEKDKLGKGLEKKLKTKRLKYCRALHAEENAILQTAIIGGMGIRDGVLYSSTFPCELCAKKIYQSGIRKVVYTEPYPMSISKEVFFRDGPRKIEFEQFEGVKSFSYFRLYKPTIDKKEFQRLQNYGRQELLSAD